MLLPLAAVCTADATGAPADNDIPGTADGQSAKQIFADADNTGVPGGVTLKPVKGLVLDTAGATVSDVDVDGTVSITAPGVTLKNCRITARGWVALDIRANDVTIENCEIDGQSAPGIRGISLSGSNVTVRGCDIHHTEDGIYLTGSSNIRIEGNYIHDLQSDWDGPHFDGIATDGGISDVSIRGNTIINPHAQTSALMLSTYFGSISAVSVSGNRLLGGGYTVYADGQFAGGTITDIAFSNNRLGKGHYGYVAITNTTPAWAENIDDALGTSVGR